MKKKLLALLISLSFIPQLTFAAPTNEELRSQIQALLQILLQLQQQLAERTEGSTGGRGGGGTGDGSTIKICNLPQESSSQLDIATDGEHIFMVAYDKIDGQYIYELDQSCRVIKKHPLSHRVFGLSYGNGSFWATGDSETSLNNSSLIEFSNNFVAKRTIDLPYGAAQGVAISGSEAWVVYNTANDEVTKTNLTTGETTLAFYAPGNAPYGVAAAENSIWIGIRGFIYQINKYTGDRISTVKSPSKGGYLSGLTFDGEYLWIVDNNDDKLYRIEAEDFNIDSSERLFVTVLYPNGGEVYTPGRNVSIGFTSNIDDKQGDGFTIQLYRGPFNSSSFMYVSDIVKEWDGGSSYTWKVPKDLAPGEYLIHITAEGIESIQPKGAEDFSNSTFTITEKDKPIVEPYIYVPSTTVKTGEPINWEFRNLQDTTQWRIDFNCADVEASIGKYGNMCGHSLESVWFKDAVFPSIIPTTTGVRDGLIHIIPIAFLRNGSMADTSTKMITVKPSLMVEPVELELEGKAYFEPGYKVGLSLSWDKVLEASKYRVTHYRKDTRGEASATHVISGNSSGSGLYRNAGAPSSCYEMKGTVEALDVSGNVIARETVSICEIGQPEKSENPKVTVLTPNGGQAFALGDSIKVEWNMSDMTIKSDWSPYIWVNLVYEKTNTKYNLGTGVRNTGSATLKIPSYLLEGRYRIEVIALYNSKQYTDVSDSWFIVGSDDGVIPEDENASPKIEVLYPNGKEVLGVGNTYTFTWNSEGMSKDTTITNPYLWINLVKEDTKEKINFGVNVKNTEEKNITLDSRVTPGQYRFEIISDYNGKRYTDISDSIFTVLTIEGSDEERYPIDPILPIY